MLGHAHLEAAIRVANGKEFSPSRAARFARASAHSIRLVTAAQTGTVRPHPVQTMPVPMGAALQELQDVAHSNLRYLWHTIARPVENFLEKKCELVLA